MPCGSGGATSDLRGTREPDVLRYREPHVHASHREAEVEAREVQEGFCEEEGQVRQVQTEGWEVCQG